MTVRDQDIIIVNGGSILSTLIDHQSIWATTFFKYYLT